MKKSHAGFWIGGAVVVIAAVYSAVVFLTKSTWSMSAWILYGFTMAAFLLTAIQCVAVARSSSGFVLDTALGVITLIYFVLQFVFGGIICMSFLDLPMVLVIVCEIILLAAYLVTVFTVYAAQSHNSSQNHNDQNAVQKMRLLERDILNMADQVTTAELKQALQKLAEDIHYSDVASFPGLADVEGRIAQNVAILQKELMDESFKSFTRIETIRQLIRERNQTAAILKR